VLSLSFEKQIIAFLILRAVEFGEIGSRSVVPCV